MSSRFLILTILMGVLFSTECVHMDRYSHHLNMKEEIVPDVVITAGPNLVQYPNTRRTHPHQDEMSRSVYARLRELNKRQDKLDTVPTNDSPLIPVVVPVPTSPTLPALPTVPNVPASPTDSSSSSSSTATLVPTEPPSPPPSPVVIVTTVVVMQPEATSSPIPATSIKPVPATTSSDGSIGMIVGISVGVLTAIFAVAAYVYIRRKKSNENAKIGPDGRAPYNWASKYPRPNPMQTTNVKFKSDKFGEQWTSAKQSNEWSYNQSTASYNSHANSNFSQNRSAPLQPFVQEHQFVQQLPTAVTSQRLKNYTDTMSDQVSYAPPLAYIYQHSNMDPQGSVNLQDANGMAMAVYVDEATGISYAYPSYAYPVSGDYTANTAISVPDPTFSKPNVALQDSSDNAISNLTNPNLKIPMSNLAIPKSNLTTQMIPATQISNPPPIPKRPIEASTKLFQVQEYHHPSPPIHPATMQQLLHSELQNSQQVSTTSFQIMDKHKIPRKPIVTRPLTNHLAKGNLESVSLDRKSQGMYITNPSSEEESLAVCNEQIQNKIANMTMQQEMNSQSDTMHLQSGTMHSQSDHIHTPSTPIHPPSNPIHSPPNLIHSESNPTHSPPDHGHFHRYSSPRSSFASFYSMDQKMAKEELDQRRTHHESFILERIEEETTTESPI